MLIIFIDWVSASQMFSLKESSSSFQVRLVDAGFIWTEPHSKRLKVKLAIQKEVGSQLFPLYM